MMTPVRAPAPRPAGKRPTVVKSPGKAAAPAKKANSIAAQQARAKGFALDLTQGGPDADDADFKAYA
jgi:methyl-accepting chemotaxis protein